MLSVLGPGTGQTSFSAACNVATVHQVLSAGCARLDNDSHHVIALAARLTDNIMLFVYNINKVAVFSDLISPTDCHQKMLVRPIAMPCPAIALWLCSESKAGQESGMVLPFDPMTMTFKDLHYFVPIPKVLLQQGW